MKELAVEPGVMSEHTRSAALCDAPMPGWLSGGGCEAADVALLAHAAPSAVFKIPPKSCEEIFPKEPPIEEVWHCVNSVLPLGSAAAEGFVPAPLSITFVPVGDCMPVYGSPEVSANGTMVSPTDVPEVRAYAISGKPAVTSIRNDAKIFLMIL